MPSELFLFFFYTVIGLIFSCVKPEQTEQRHYLLSWLHVYMELLLFLAPYWQDAGDVHSLRSYHTTQLDKSGRK